ncbi:MAG: mechanosensitive ion channel family protein, partial [Planctomycetota bacterium]
RYEIELNHLKKSEAEDTTGEKEKLNALKAALIKKKSGLVDRCEMVKEAFLVKGGDVGEIEKYIATFTPSMGDDLTDLSSVDTDLVKNLLIDLKEWVIKPEGGIKWGLKILLFILILIASKIASVVLGGITARAVGSLKKTSELLRDFFVNTVKKLTVFIGVVIALSVVGLDIGPFLAAMGMVGFIVGFALQGTLSNFASGIMILLYRPYDIGDAVSVTGVSGKVASMTLVSTTINTFDNQKVVVPNGSIWGNVITNMTGSPTRRVDMVFGIGYGDDIAKAQKILEEIVTSHPKVLKDPAPVIKLHELADSSVNFVTRPWSKTGDYWDVYWDITRSVKERFDAEGVSIPFPQRDVHLFNEAAK